ncbi:MAG: hypothetical protein J2P25_21880 [Nocardiopsaceae bacterium]|nr:hypothetical protein [Nocardiopsaceae bacterium]
MTFVITPEDRASFRRCRRQWDFGSLERRNLEPAQPTQPPRSNAGSEVGQAVTGALDIYYFPGMWDWDRAVTLPLVIQGFERAMAGQRERCGASEDEEPWPRLLEAGRRLLGRYAQWAPTVDGFSPVMVEAEYEATVLDPDRPGAGLVTTAGEPVRYRGRIGMLVVDASDAYWIVRHSAVEGGWPATENLLDDEEAAAECRAWEDFYPGMTIAGTIYNEFRLPPPAKHPPAPPATEPGPRLSRLVPRQVRGVASALHTSLGAVRGSTVRGTPGNVAGRVRQHEPSGGGRSIPQHRRLYAAAREPKRVKRVMQHSGEEFRRTLVRRSPEELTAAWRRLAADASMMIAPGLTLEPTPSDVNCPPCPFRAPCLAMFAGEDAEAIVRSAYRKRPPVTLEEGRLGGGAWSQGRGAAPPHLRGSK